PRFASAPLPAPELGVFSPLVGGPYPVLGAESPFLGELDPVLFEACRFRNLGCRGALLLSATDLPAPPALPRIVHVHRETNFERFPAPPAAGQSRDRARRFAGGVPPLHSTSARPLVPRIGVSYPPVGGRYRVPGAVCPLPAWPLRLAGRRPRLAP